MEGNKGYRGGNDLFVCFPSRSSLRTGQKPVQSPGRMEKYKETGGNKSIGSCSSRRKGGQSSPMFPLLLRRRNAGSISDTASAEEPTSPKVTCIGQVRVKSKNAGKGTDSLRNIKKEVCDTFRSLGSELSCIFPCSGGPPASSSGKQGNGKHTSACGSALMAKFVMILQDSDEKHQAKLEASSKIHETGLDSMKFEDPFGKTKDSFDEMENPCEKNQDRMRRSLRRFQDDDDDDNDWIQAKIGDGDGVEYCRRYDHVGEEEEDEEPVCVPPKNALLLMRCRSAPLKLSLNSQLWMAHSNGGELDQPQEKAHDVESHTEDSSKVKLVSSGDEDEACNDEMAREKSLNVVQGSGETAVKKKSHQRLLLMHCEPELTKLSLEISKETWVPSRDFFRKPLVSQDGSRSLSKESNDQEECSKGRVAKLLEDKFSPPPEAFMLTRSKSEPRKVSVKLAPEACLWKRRNLGKPLNLEI